MERVVPYCALAGFLTALAALFLGFRARLLCWIMACAGVIAFLVLLAVSPPTCYDLHFFWEGGRDTWSNDDPYASQRFLNPPTSLPLFAVLALLPFDVLRIAFALLNAIGYAALPFITRRALFSHGKDTARLESSCLMMLSALILCSCACRHGFNLGQLALLTTILIIGGLYLADSGRHVVAGTCFAVATVKVATLLPFLLLFPPRAYRVVWISLAGACLGLALLGSFPTQLLGRCGACLQNIQRLASPGQLNDYVYENQSSVDLVGFEQLLHRVGVRNRALNRALFITFVTLLGLWIAYLVSGPSRVPRPTAYCLTAFYSTLFLYHRLYDAIILVIPLVYCLGQAVSERGLVKYLYGATVLAIVAVLYMPVGGLRILTLMIPDMLQPWRSTIECLILPYATWSILLGMLLLVAADRLRLKAV